jgi:DNA primase
LGSLSANFLDELRARTPIAAVIGRSVRLVRSGREQKGCCPFHGEKTPSFYVYDDHFHCFGCGEHGDVITFVMKSTGAGFMEAVETLAGQAGLEVPKASPQAAEFERQRAGIAEILQAAAQLYRAWLFAPQGRPALDYLRGRGLTDATIETFALGWSGEGRGALAGALKQQGIGADQLIEAGLMKAGDHGPVDYFFSRVMFPIADRRGQKISFGGRILGDGQPKYVNGPETPAFSKRRSLYGLNFAREAVRSGKPLVVVEGYMDVIALSQAGFAAAAPLGTALTEDHLAELWRLTPEPVICFDSDAAGRRAAMRSADLALAGLTPQRSLKFLRLPEGEDPDSFMRARGAAAFAAQLNAALPLSAVLFEMLAEGAAQTTPEGRAAFRQRLQDTAARIPDKALAGEYRAMLLDRFFAARPGRGLKRPAAVRPPLARPPINPANADAERGRILTAILLNHPALFADVEEAFFLLDLPPPCAVLREAMAKFIEAGEPAEPAALAAALHKNALAQEGLRVLNMAPLPAVAAPGASLAEAADFWWELFGLMRSSRIKLRDQCDEQRRLYLQAPDDPAVVQRFIRLNAARSRADRAEREID